MSGREPDGVVIGDLKLDLSRAVWMPRADVSEVGRAIVALANSKGGEILAGVRLGDGDGPLDVVGIEAELFADVVDEAVRLIDPAVSHLVEQRVIEAEGATLGLVRVRLSPSAPHLFTGDGGIYLMGDGGVSRLRSRRTLDDLYARGRGERERADRLVEAMIEKLSLGHYAFYSLAVVACTHQPSAEAFRAAQHDPGWLAPPDDAFIQGAALHEHEANVSVGDLELRTPDEENTFLRVTRSGCVAAGEVLRRPYHTELDTEANLALRLSRICATVARVLGASSDALMLPHLFVEGVRGMRLVREEKPRVVSGSAPQDTLRAPLSVGDARDAAYVARLPGEAMERLVTLFPPAQE